MIENIGAYSQFDYDRGYQQGIADAIEPINAIIQESERMMWHSSKTLKKIQEQLKELTNDN